MDRQIEFKVLGYTIVRMGKFEIYMAGMES